MSLLTIPCRTGEISDGYHTFDELYLHRCVLFLALMKSHPKLSWFSRLHDDGTMFGDYFIMGINLPVGTVTYHAHIDLIGLAEATGAQELPRAPAWDGHTSDDVVRRLKATVRGSFKYTEGMESV